MAFRRAGVGRLNTAQTSRGSETVSSPMASQLCAGTVTVFLCEVVGQNFRVVTLRSHSPPTSSSTAASAIRP